MKPHESKKQGQNKGEKEGRKQRAIKKQRAIIVVQAFINKIKLAFQVVNYNVT
jgi:hypothetical protein